MSKTHPVLAARASRVSPFLVMDLFERAKELQRAGHDLVHLEVGEPDFATPKVVVDAGKAALELGYTHYASPLGDPELRETIVAHYKKRYGVTINPRQVLIFPGSSPAITLLALALMDHGDEVLISNPCYPAYRNLVRFAGATPVEVETSETDGFRFEPADIARRITPRTKAMFINSPGNPTGILLEGDRMKALAELGPLVISDEIYHGLSYADDEHTILEYTDNAVVINGFSKAYAMTGWRLGYLIVPEWLVRPLETLLQTMLICVSAATQRAGIVALTQTDVEVASMRNTYNERRKIILSGLTDLGFNMPVEPMGAFYAFVNARHINPDSLALCNDLLTTVHLGVSPGIDFGTQSEGFIRFSYASSVDNIREGLRRLKSYIEKK